jgi:hypothetical protein
MHLEADTPLEQRYLWLEGRLSSARTKTIQSGLPPCPPNADVFLVGFSYANLPFTKQFDIVFPKNRPQDGVRCTSRVVAATQQMGKPFSQIPHGWKTVCIIQFADGIPQLVKRLPTVDTWYQNDEWVCICDEQAWEALKMATKNDDIQST